MSRPATPTRVLALWSPDWPVTAAAMAARVPTHRPAAVVVANRVLACSAVARAHGVRRGLRRREAQARCPDLAVLAPDPDRDARAFEPVVAAVEELAPGVEVVRPGLVALPARGPVSWFGGELEAAEALVDQVAARTGVECQVGVADGLFAAVLAARRALIVAPGDTPAFLAPLGVEELDREPDVDRSELVGLLRRLGLRSLGAFAALDPEDVASRFGADAVLCHRLARGLDPRPPVRRTPPEELAVEVELDPPVDRVDAAAFAARGLAERLHRTLASHGLSCTRLGVAARTVGGEELHRIWRCAEPLTPAGTVDRVRWQLDAWLTRRRRAGDLPDEAEGGAVALLRLVPEETVTAGALQLGLWGDVGEADERAGRALVRVQALLGPESVVTAVLVGGRDPDEQVRFVPWGDDRDLGLPAPAAEPPERRLRPAGSDASAPAGEERTWASSGPDVAPAGWPEDVVRSTGRVSAADLPEAERMRTTNRRRRVPAPRRPAGRPVPRDPPPSWPGRLPAPSPATVPPRPIPAELTAADGSPVRLRAPDLLLGLPGFVAVDGGAPRRVQGWAGPWPVQQRWWEGRSEASRLQVALDDGGALLLVFRDDRWWVAGEYD
ncbi:MAG TPA: DNA polymerase Y family protein [Pseudonocardia sp.]|jgi:protein ImuB|uniref:DNA polymerase Y family protein n=1 Tax=Pseudonocardia sp. TaxID=60912 RepID=UPI002B4B435A|nr:DNA polymerase Y family protein [Pseudonocardia sp.]HLU53845.1 DNA polymerase Y family protein [Pseudonocardia sp.]